MIKVISKFIPNFIKKRIISYLDKNYLFVGWNLKTKTCPPWKNTIYENKILQSNYFNDLNEELIEKIKNGEFLLNQKKNEKDQINQLKWRHYNILLSLKYLKQLKKEKINLVEAGVADGLTAWFALSFLEREKINYNQFTLIDSWEQMKLSLLKQSESKQVGRHKENDIEITKKNLVIFEKTKFLIPGDLTIGQFIYVIRKRVKLIETDSLFLFINDKTIPLSSSLISSVYEEHKDEDGFLYVSYCNENVFG